MPESISGRLWVSALFSGSAFYFVFVLASRMVSGRHLRKERYVPNRVVILACAVVIVITATYSVRLSYTEGVAQLAEADKQRQAVEAARARVAALTPEQREAELKRARDTAAAAAEAAASQPPSQPAPASKSAKAPEASQHDAQVADAASAVRVLPQEMRNPESFKLVRVLAMKSKTECIDYRAQNGFGGLNVEHAVAKEGHYAVGPGGQDIWAQYCAGKRGTDITADVVFLLKMVQ